MRRAWAWGLKKINTVYKTAKWSLIQATTSIFDYCIPKPLRNIVADSFLQVIAALRLPLNAPKIRLIKNSNQTKRVLAQSALTNAASYTTPFLLSYALYNLVYPYFPDYPEEDHKEESASFYATAYYATRLAFYTTVALVVARRYLRMKIDGVFNNASLSKAISEEHLDGYYLSFLSQCPKTSAFQAGYLYVYPVGNEFECATLVKTLENQATKIKKIKISNQDLKANKLEIELLNAALKWKHNFLDRDQEKAFFEILSKEGYFCKHLKPCGCGKGKSVVADLIGLGFYGVDLGIAWSVSFIPQYGKHAAFFLKALIQGKMFLDYALSSAELCAEHRRDHILKNQIYALVIGSMSETLIILGNNFIKWLTGIETVFAQHFVAGLFFQYFLTMSLINNRLLPGKIKSIDIFHPIHYLVTSFFLRNSQTSLDVRQLFEWVAQIPLIKTALLKEDLSSLDQFVKKPAISLFLDFYAGTMTDAFAVIKTKKEEYLPYIYKNLPLNWRVSQFLVPIEYQDERKQRLVKLVVEHQLDFAINFADRLLEARRNSQKKIINYENKDLTEDIAEAHFQKPPEEEVMDLDPLLDGIFFQKKDNKEPVILPTKPNDQPKKSLTEMIVEDYFSGAPKNQAIKEREKKSNSQDWIVIESDQNQMPHVAERKSIKKNDKKLDQQNPKQSASELRRHSIFPIKKMKSVGKFFVKELKTVGQNFNPSTVRH